MTTVIYLITLAVLSGTPLAIFGLKYWAAAKAADVQTETQAAYRKLAADAVTAQSGNAATLSAIQSELAELKTRMAGIEKILKEVE
jgi:Tfp pilus assembly protein PilO